MYAPRALASSRLRPRCVEDLDLVGGSAREQLCLLDLAARRAPRRPSLGRLLRREAWIDVALTRVKTGFSRRTGQPRMRVERVGAATFEAARAWTSAGSRKRTSRRTCSFSRRSKEVRSGGHRRRVSKRRRCVVDKNAGGRRSPPCMLRGRQEPGERGGRTAKCPRIYVGALNREPRKEKDEETGVRVAQVTRHCRTEVMPARPGP